MKLLFIETATKSIKEFKNPLPPMFLSTFNHFITKGARIHVSIQKLEERMEPFTSRDSGVILPSFAKEANNINLLTISQDLKDSAIDELAQDIYDNLSIKRNELKDIYNNCWLECSKFILDNCSTNLIDPYKALLNNSIYKALFQFNLHCLEDTLLVKRKAKLEKAIDKKLKFQQEKEAKEKAEAEKLGSTDTRIKNLEKQIAKLTLSNNKPKAKPKPKPAASNKPKPSPAKHNNTNNAKTATRSDKVNTPNNVNTFNRKNAEGVNTSASANPTKASKKRRSAEVGLNIPRGTKKRF